MTKPLSLRVLIVDDERYARERLLELLDRVETVLHRSGGDYAVRLTDRTTLKVS